MTRRPSQPAKPDGGHDDRITKPVRQPKRATIDEGPRRGPSPTNGRRPPDMGDWIVGERH